MQYYILFPPLAHTSMTPAPPVGLAYLAAVLKPLAGKITALSADVLGLDVERTLERVIDQKPDVLAISVSTPAVNNAVSITQRVKKALKDIKVIAGGPHATLFPDDMINSGVDIVVRGEGEETLVDLGRYFIGEKDISAIGGVSYKSDNRVVHHADRPLIKDLDNIPFPAWEYFSIDRYESTFKRSRLSLPIVSARGCPGKCTFCYKGIFGRRFRVRSPENILNEVLYLKERFNIDEFSIIDDCFTIIPERAIQFCDLLQARKIRIPWSLPAGIRVDTVSAELLTSLKAAGCYRVGFGIETGNADIMKKIKKGITLEQVRKAVALSKKAGLECTTNFMIGNLGETTETIDDSIRFALELDADYAQFSRAVPFPGSEMYNQLKKEGKIITRNWDDYDYLLTDKQVFVHDNLNQRQIRKKMKEAYRKFYLRPGFIFREIRKKLSREGVRKLLITIPFALKRFF